LAHKQKSTVQFNGAWRNETVLKKLAQGINSVLEWEKDHLKKTFDELPEWEKEHYKKTIGRELGLEESKQEEQA